jgi:hypothetical protein
MAVKWRGDQSMQLQYEGKNFITQACQEVN